LIANLTGALCLSYARAPVDVARFATAEKFTLEAVHWPEGNAQLQKAPVLGCALVGLGQVFTEWNDLDAALPYTQAGLERGEQTGILDN
jgi:hypothetical protein